MRERQEALGLGQRQQIPPEDAIQTSLRIEMAETPLILPFVQPQVVKPVIETQVAQTIIETPVRKPVVEAIFPERSQLGENLNVLEMNIIPEITLLGPNNETGDVSFTSAGR